MSDGVTSAVVAVLDILFREFVLNRLLMSEEEGIIRCAFKNTMMGTGHTCTDTRPLGCILP